MISRYCSRCHSVKPLNHLHRTPDHRPGARQRGYDSDWETTRSIYLDRFPFCHYKNCRQYAKHVHHLDGQGPNGPRGHDFANLQGLCASHHNKITGEEHGFDAR